ncbi:phosphoadenylyl-sulfate reductase [Zooshikella ganghwensis]|uniref:Adenosine 5'-phosphosulfate reductase n=1 Tax=Zooshikella ganghwensis TaxID=202772 RepID=A0A4V1INL4_9GAMM|nr:phosphoadenylyl-sulfate reductase [Zooshikella ganghwensis]
MRSFLVSLNIAQLNLEYSNQDPVKIMELAVAHFPELAISFSGAEDVVLIDLASRVSDTVRVFSLDTGRLHPETYQFIEAVRDHYGIAIELLSPETQAVETLVKEKGLFSFYKEGHQECCGLRKIAPLRRKLSTLSAWVTGQRKDQSPSTRAHIPVIEQDHTFGSEQQPLIKFNPLANWSSEQVWNYIRMFELPYNTLHERGFVSIGCEPCTRPVLPNQHEREGRWWWEASTQKECGLHAGNIPQTD